MSQTALKLLAVVFMTIDHIGSFIPNMPLWLRVIGRLAAPLFLFCLVEGYYHTSNKKRYVWRFYCLGVLMAVANGVILYFSGGKSFDNNIFAAFFCILFMVYLSQSTLKHKKMWIFSYVIASLVIAVFLMFCSELWNVPLYYIQLISAATGNFYTCEGGILTTVWGLLLFVAYKNKKRLIVGTTLYAFALYTNIRYRIFSIITAIIDNLIIKKEINFFTGFINYIGIPTMLSQYEFYSFTGLMWAGVFALPFMLLYNGKRGRGFKYFFYLYYPLHIYILYFIGLQIAANQGLLYW